MKCAHCPVGPGLACPAVTLPHPRYCELVATRRDYDATLVRMASGPAGLPPFPPFRPPDGRVRVGLASPGAYLGGAERCMGDYLDHCDGARIRWEGVVAIGSPSVPAIPSVVADWSEHGPVAFGEAALAELARRVDVLVPWGIPSATLARLLPPGLPVVQVSHCAFDTPAAHDLCGLPGSTVVAVSRSALRGIAPGRRDAARLILNAVPATRAVAARPRAEMLRDWGLPPDAKVAGWLARISREKNPHAFLDAVAALPAGWHGVMVGAGLARAEAEAHAARVAPGRVVFAGPTEAVGDALGAFDAFVLPSAAEGCCLSLIEAWLAGCPAIGTPVGMLEDFPGLARLVPNPPTGRDIAAAILADAADPAGTSARAELAKGLAGSLFAPARFGREWTDLLCSLARPPEPVTPATRPSVDEMKGLLARVKACPSRTPPGCGCPSADGSCSLGKGRGGLVNLAECIQCRRSSPDA